MMTKISAYTYYLREMSLVEPSLSSYIQSVGLTQTKYWLVQLESMGITSVDSLKIQKGNTKLFSSLKRKVQSDHDIEKLLQLLEINSGELSIVSCEEELSNQFEDIIKCNHLQGILLTNNLDDILLEKNNLFNFPERCEITSECFSSTMTRTFFSKDDEDVFKKATVLLGCGFDITKKKAVYGDIHNPILDSISEKRKKRKRVAEGYMSTVKYKFFSGVKVSFDITQLELCDEAKTDLSVVLTKVMVGKWKNVIHKECMKFLQFYGSHIPVGPMHFGGYIVWICSSKNIVKNDEAVMASVQNHILESAIQNDSTEIDKAKYSDLCSDQCLNNTHLSKEVLGGPAEATILYQTKADVYENFESTVLVDRGNKLVAIWDLLKQSMEYQNIAENLKHCWEKLTSLKATVDNVSCNETLHNLGLSMHYSKKICLTDAVCIRSDILDLSVKGESCKELSQLPFLVLHKVMSYDSKCLSDLLSPASIEKSSSSDMTSSADTLEDYVDLDDEEVKMEIDAPNGEGVYPMDCLHALLLCCDDLLRQDLFSRLAKCQLSVPFLMPDPVKKTLILPIWAMRSIIKEWTPHDKPKQPHSIVTYPMPIISFIRLGQHKSNGFSKSKILNSLISDIEKSPFFHYDCPGGNYPRVFSEGLVDMSWYLPSGKPSDTFDDAIVFLNLHGDARKFPLQSEVLTQISSLCFVLIVNENIQFSSHDMALLKVLNDSPMGLQILNAVDKKPSEIREFARSQVINLSNKNANTIRVALCQKIKYKMSKVEQHKSIAEVAGTINNDIIIDENSEVNKMAFEYAQKIRSHINTVKDSEHFKDLVVPLQGKLLWQEWADKNKELNRHHKRGNVSIYDYSAKIEKEKEIIRKKQLKHVRSKSDVMKTFIDTLSHLGRESDHTKRDYFLQTLNLLLNEDTRKCVGEWYINFLNLKEELSNVSSVCSKKEKAKKEEYMKVQNKILEASFGLEHLFREIGQIYEAAHNVRGCKLYCSQLLNIIADLVIDGYPLELMDGDAAHVPLQWIKAVIKDVIKKIGDQKVYVLSVLGVQSSGKSTMLNAVFGLQFKVSAGRCTRGAFMQLIQVDSNIESRTGCRYILVVDTEGLRAPENNKIEKYEHDNELATFVIGLANTTLFNIKGEVSRDMDDILQTSVHAFLRMSEVKNHRSCQFIHQNCSSGLILDAESTKLTNKLDEFTKEVAKNEQCSSKYHCFNDVIRYNDIHGKHYFPALWKGDPPMAPVNDGYSEKAQSLKLHIINRICQQGNLKNNKDLQPSFTGQNLSLFVVNFCSLWEALLKEDFIFSFKNTLELNAYKSLLKNYSQWEFDFREKIIFWTQTVENEIKGCKPADVSSETLEVWRNKLQLYVSNKHDELKEKMDTFLKGEYHEILIQWRQRFEIKLKGLADQLEQDAIDHCTKLIRSKKELSDFLKKRTAIVDDIKQKVHVHIQEVRDKRKVLEESLLNKTVDLDQFNSLYERDLFSDEKLSRYKSSSIDEKHLKKIIQLKQKNKGKLSKQNLKKVILDVLSSEEMKLILKLSPQPERKLKGKFDSIWDSIIGEVCYTRLEISNEVKSIVHKALHNHIKVKGRRLVTKLTEKPLELWRHTDLEVEKTKHYIVLEEGPNIDISDESLLNLIYEKGKKYFKKTPKDNYHIQALEITNRVLFQARNKMLELTKEAPILSEALISKLLRYVDEIINSASSQTRPMELFFTEEYKIEMSARVCSISIPDIEEMVERLEDEHDPRVHLERFEKTPLFTMYKNEYMQTEAEESIADTFCVYLEKPVIDQIKQTIGTKMISKMKSSKPYLADKASLKVKILSELLEQDDFNELIQYITNIESSFMEHIKKYTIEFCNQVVPGENLTELQSAACNEVNRLVENITNTFQMATDKGENLKQVFNIFCNDQNLHRLIAFDFEADTFTAGYHTLKKLKLENLKDKVIKQLKDLEIRVKEFFSKIECKGAMKYWSHQPHELLNNIIGCTAACPFCGEQCDIMDVDHLNDQPHRTEIHRLNCLNGWRMKENQIMATGFCPSLVSSNGKFWKSDVLYEHKKYKEVYPDWAITPNLTSKSALCWRWFIMKYRQELAEYYEALPAHIPEHWKEYSKEDILEDLKAVYNL